MNVSNNWSGVFKNLEVANRFGGTDYYKYTVKEVGENGNTILFNGKLYKVVYKGSMKDGFTITNEKEVPPTPPPPTPNDSSPNNPLTPTPNDSSSDNPLTPTPNNSASNNLFTPIPSNPTPNEPQVSNTGTSHTLPKTGDGSNISLYAWLILILGVLLVFIGYRRRKHGK